jgi:PhoPQ-activated pathogenicity-related protein
MAVRSRLWIFATAAAVVSAKASGNSEPSVELNNCPSGYSIRGSCVPVGTSPLQFYVDMPDPTYSYMPEPIQTFGLPGATAFVLNMTSQRWLTDDDFKPYSPSKSVWWHQLVVVVPNKLNKQLETGWIWITGGDNTDGGKPIDTKDGEVAIAGELAAASGTVCAVLRQIPNQPVAFTVDIPHDRRLYPRELRGEDGIIAYTWNHFVLKDNHSPEWLLRMPMTKAVVRAMDTVTDYVRFHWIFVSVWCGAFPVARFDTW